MEEMKATPLVEHLEELRKRIIVSGAGFLALFLGSFLFVKDIYRYLIKDLEQPLTVLSPGDIIWANVALAAVCGLALSIPLFAYQLWRFMEPAMKPNERKATLAFIPGLFLLFVAGLCFSFFVIFPMVMRFLNGLAEEQFQTMYTVGGYFTFMFRLTVPVAVVFELPAIVMFLTRIGLLDPHKLKKSRKYAYFTLVVLSVLLSPPDFLSDVLLILPMLLLYEISIMLSAWVKRRTVRLELSQT